MSNRHAQDLIELLEKRGESLALAESCTGGGIAAALTDIPGSSSVLWGGVVSYANEAKTELLNVEPELLVKAGAVSRGVAQSMAWGIRCLSGVDWTCAVTGIAGPGGGTPDKPVGTVWIAWCGPEGQPVAELFHFDGDRASVRNAAVDAALAGLINILKNSNSDIMLDR